MLKSCMHRARVVSCVSAMAVAFMVTGCGDSGPKLGRVSGTVKLNGKPVPRAQLTFVPDGPGRSASGLANKDGEYVMEYTPDTPGALVGPVTVQIRTRTTDTPETIPVKYNDKTELKRNVESGRNVFDFELEGEVKPPKTNGSQPAATGASV